MLRVSPMLIFIHYILTSTSIKILTSPMKKVPHTCIFRHVEALSEGLTYLRDSQGCPYPFTEKLIDGT